MQYTATNAKNDYPPNIKRSQVIELGKRAGLKEGAVRALIDGADAPLRPRCLAGQRYGYFRLTEVVAAFFPAADSDSTS